MPQEPIKIIQPSFTAGELSPSLAGRVDLAKYRAGAAVLENFIVQPQGGAINRPGFQFIVALPERVRLIPFQFSVYQSYILAFGDYTMYVIKQGGVVVGPGAAAAIVTPYAFSDVAKLRFTQSADTVFFAHSSYPPYMLQRTSDVDWTFTPMTFQVVTPAPTGLAAGYQYGDPHTKTTQSIEYQVSAVATNGEESLPSPAVTVVVDYPWYSTGTVVVSWNEVPGATQYKVYKNSRGYFGLIGILSPNFSQTIPVVAIESGHLTTNAPGLAFDNDLTTFWEAATLAADQYIGQDFGTPTLVTGFRLNQGITGAATLLNVPVSFDYSADNVNWTSEQAFTILGGKNVWQTFELTTPITARYVRLRQTLPRFTFRWQVAELQFQDTQVGRQFIDDNINEDVSNGPQTTQNVFPGPDDYPGAVGLYQQRLFFARTNNNPQAIWATQTGLYNNMGISFPLKATDALTVALNGQGVNEIKFLVPLNNLLAFASDAEWVVGPGSNADGITPTAIAANLQGYRGSADVPPIPVGRCVLFVQRNGTVVREMDYSSYFSMFTSLFAPTNDVSIFSNHLFDGHSILEWSYQQTPYYTIWAVRDDGTLLGFTYIKEQQITAWHRHTTEGTFLSVASIDEGNGQTELYVLTQRAGGYFIERMFHRIPIGSAVFLDAALTYSGAPATVFAGLGHLEGQEVGIVADGSVVARQTVVGGRVILSQPASVAAVGLPYISSVQTMKLEQEMGGGTLQGRLGVIPRLVTRFQDTRGGWVGPDFDNLVEIPWRDGEAYNAATNMLTGDLINIIEPDWRRGFVVCVRQVDPLPMSLLSIIPELVPSET